MYESKRDMLFTYIATILNVLIQLLVQWLVLKFKTQGCSILTLIKLSSLMAVFQRGSPKACLKYQTLQWKDKEKEPINIL